jgi:hypothetical protein
MECSAFAYGKLKQGLGTAQVGEQAAAWLTVIPAE